MKGIDNSGALSQKQGFGRSLGGVNSVLETIMKALRSTGKKRSLSKNLVFLEYKYTNSCAHG